MKINNKLYSLTACFAIAASMVASQALANPQHGNCEANLDQCAAPVEARYDAARRDCYARQDTGELDEHGLTLCLLDASSQYRAEMQVCDDAYWACRFGPYGLVLGGALQQGAIIRTMP